jgi:fatty acid desaturase
MHKRLRAAEWPTLAQLTICYALWSLGTTTAADAFLPLGVVLTVFATALHASLTHETCHGHPFRSPFWNAALVFPVLSLTVPYLRFKDTHLGHHRDSRLTDPYDDPESNYLDPAVWAGLPRWAKAVLRANNTLAGRLALGPVLGTLVFWRDDARLMMQGDRRVMLGWLLHIPAVGVVLWWMLAVAQMPLWAWGLSVYAALAILKIRTFLEHRAHEQASGRTVIIEDTGPLALIFLNNNLHAVHHMHAAAPWYRLPSIYRANPARYLDHNDGYRYRSYAEIFRRHLWRAKDPVPHPLWPKP